MARYDFAGAEQRRLERHRQLTDRAAALDAQITPQLAARALQLTQTNPRAQSGTVQTLASLGVPDEQAVEVMSQDDGGGFSPFDLIGDVISKGWQAIDAGTFGAADWTFNQVWQRAAMPTLRGAFVAFDSLYKEAVEAPLVSLGTSVAEAADRSFLHDTVFRGQDIVQGAEGERASLNPLTNYQEYGRSAGFRAVQSIFDPNIDFDLGGGVLVDHESEIGQMVRDDHRLRARGEAANLGNLNTAFYLTPTGQNPGDTAYDVMSGIWQLASEVLLDPATLLFAGSNVAAKGAARLGVSEPVETAIRGGISGARARARAVDQDEALRLMERIREVRDEAGNVVDEAAEAEILDDMMGLVNSNAANTRQRTILPEKALPWASNRQIVDRLAEMDPYELQQLWAGRGANRVPGELIGALGKETDPTRITEILTEAIATKAVREKGFFTPRQIWWQSKLNENKIARVLSFDGKVTGAAGGGVMPSDDLWLASRKAKTVMDAGNVPVEGYVKVRSGDDTILKLTDELDETDEVVGEAFGGQRQVINEILTLEPGNMMGMKRVIDEMLTAVKYNTPEWGGKGQVDWDSAQRFIKLWRDETETMIARLQRFNTGEVGRPIPSLHDKVALLENGEEVVAYQPHLVSEAKQLADTVLPDITEIRRAASDYKILRDLYQTTGWDKSARAFRSLTHAWKKFVLYRLAYIARTLPDDQARAHFKGYESIFDGPYSYITGNVTNGKAARMMTGGDLMDRKEAHRLFNIGLNPRERMARSQTWGQIFKQENFVDEFDEAGELIGRTYSPEFLDAWYTELAQLASDDAGRYLLANPDDFTGLREWLLSDETIPLVTPNRTGAEARQGMKFTLGEDVFDLVERGGPEWEQFARSWQERIRLKFSGDPNTPVPRELADAALGRSEHFNFFDDLTEGRTGMREFLNRHADEYAPLGLKREVPVGARGRRGIGGVERDERGLMTTITDFLGDNIIRKPANYFSRNPLWRQSIVRNLEDMMPAMTREMREQVVEKATSYGVSDQWMARLRKAADNASGEGFMDNLGKIEEAAIRQATFEVEDLLFDVSTRSAFQEQHEVFVPFIDAWRESLVVWGDLVKKHPEVITRGMSIFRGGESSGFIHTDENGERMFTIPNPTPALRTMLNALPGSPGDAVMGSAEGDARQVRLSARVEAINLVFSSVGPGFGPVVQWPMAAFAPKGFHDSGLADLVLPYGSELESPGDIVNPMALAKQLAPAWAKKTLNAATSGGWDELQYQSMVNEAVDAIATTGDYDLSNPDELARLERDAKRSASWLMLLRGLAHGTLPAGPGAEHRIRVEDAPGFEPEPWDPDSDPTGQWYTIGQMATAYRELWEELGDPELATRQFVRQYGYEPYFLSQPLTRSFGPRPTDPGAAQWMDEHAELVRDHPHVAGYFAPDTESDDPFAGFDTFKEQIEEGTREIPDTDVQIALAQRTKAYQMYNNFKKLLPGDLPRSDRNQRLADFRAVLTQHFPGWQNPVNAVGPTKLQGTEQFIDEFRAVSNDPVLSDNPTAKLVRAYIRLRDEALARHRERVGDPRASLGRQDASHIRQALTAIGTQLKESDDSGGFIGPWRILQRELEVE